MNCSPPGSSVHGFSRQEYWSGLPCPPPEDLPDPGIKPAFLLSSALVGRFFTTSANFPEWPSKSCLAPLYLMVLIIVHSQDDSIISMRKSILGPTQWGQFTPSSLLFCIQLILVLLLCSLRSSIQQRIFQGSWGIRGSPEPSNRALIIKVAVGNHTRTSPEPLGRGSDHTCPQLCKEMGSTVSPWSMNFQFCSESAFVKSNNVSLVTQWTQSAIYCCFMLASRPPGLEIKLLYY